MEVKFRAYRDYINEPVRIECPDISWDVRSVVIGSKRFPASRLDIGGRTYLCAVVDAKAGDHVMTVSEDQCIGGHVCGIIEDGSCIAVTIDGKPFTKYYFGSDLAKPYLGPVLSKDGISFTRLNFAEKEHPHQRSVFIAVGDVRLKGLTPDGEEGVDFWNEPQNRGAQIHKKLGCLYAMPSYMMISADNVWQNADGVPMLDESRSFVMYPQDPECRYIDVTTTFTASYGDIEFGPTKEAGPLGIRVADGIRGDRGGHIRNSWGGIAEKECWGRPAVWCDYSGEINGHKLGVAVFDDERNERFPTTWHIRDYGLFAANNLYFRGGLRIAAGESLTYHWRLVFHEGDCDVASKYIIYENQNHISR